MRGIALGLLAGGCASPSETPRPDSRAPMWRLEGLADRESVAIDADGRSLYIAGQGEGDVKDGNGLIGRISRPAGLLGREWVTC